MLYNCLVVIFGYVVDQSIKIHFYKSKIHIYLKRQKSPISAQITPKSGGLEAD